jgi:hypothetical protein
MPTGSMSTGCVDFVLTVLANGQVLAAGGDGYNVTFSDAELYNPATGTWTPTGSMAAGYSGGGAVLLHALANGTPIYITPPPAIGLPRRQSPAVAGSQVCCQTG